MNRAYLSFTGFAYTQQILVLFFFRIVQGQHHSSFIISTEMNKKQYAKDKEGGKSAQHTLLGLNSKHLKDLKVFYF